MKRTVASISMRKGNFNSLDPAYSGCGLTEGTGNELFKRIWREYEQDRDRVLAQARIT